MKHPTLLLAAILSCTATAHAVDYKGQIAPIFKQYCYKCHSEAEKKEKGKLVLDNLKRFGARIAEGKMIVAGNPDASSFYKAFGLPVDDDDHMPPDKSPQLNAAQIALIKGWIAEGATFDGSKKTAAAPAAPAPAAPAAGGGMQSWTSTDGKVIQAKFVRLDGDNVVIQRDDGATFSVPLSRLSPESQAQAKKGG
jgi:cytochrome c